MITSWQTEERKRCQETDKARVSHLQVLLFRIKSSTFLSLLKKELDNNLTVSKTEVIQIL